MSESEFVPNSSPTGNDQVAVMDLMANGKIRTEDIRPCTIGLDDLQAVLEGMAAGTSSDINVLVVPRGV